jgi:hypothetical protein
MLAQTRRSKLSSPVNKPRSKTPAARSSGSRSHGEHVEELARLSEEKRLLVRTLPVRRELLCDLANTKPEPDPVKWFQEKWHGRIREEPLRDLIELGEQLRSVWKRPRIAGAEKILDKWLAWRPLAATFRKYKESAIERPDAVKAKDYLPFECSIGAGRLVPNWVHLRAMLIQGVLEHWKNFRFCANADCAAPYFIAKRMDQTVCDAEICKAEKQRAHKLKWWHENRAKKSDPRKHADRKRTGKGRTG